MFFGYSAYAENAIGAGYDNQFMGDEPPVPKAYFLFMLGDNFAIEPGFGWNTIIG